MRQAIQPAFVLENITADADAMGQVAADMATTWDDGQRLDAHEVARSLTARILSHTLFGADLRDDEREATIKRAARALRDRFDMGSPSSILPDWAPTPRIRRYRRASADLDALVTDLIAERRARPDAHDDLLAALVRRSADVEALDEAALRDNAKGLLIAGHDTTAVALAAALGCLSLDRAAQRRVREEARRVADGTPGAESLSHLTYTDAVARETLRLYPPGPGVFRETSEPVTVDGYRIPSGGTVDVSPWVTQRDERWLDDPQEFRPARWRTDENHAADGERPEYAYFPFGGGPRHCIGMRFAMAELTLAVATFCRRVVIESPMDEMPAMSGGMTLSPASPIELTVRGVE